MSLTRGEQLILRNQVVMMELLRDQFQYDGFNRSIEERLAQRIDESNKELGKEADDGNT